MRWTIGLTAVFLATASAAQTTETVAVDKDRGLVGLWRIEVPDGFHVNLFHNANFGPMRPIYCRIEGGGAIHCLSGGYSASGTVTLEENKVHIAWGSAMARMDIDADIAGSGFAGIFTFKFSGIRHDAPTTSISTRLSGMAGTQGPEASDGLSVGDVGRAAASALPNLGPVAQVAYLGTSPNLQGGGDPDYFHVYAIEFNTGERICGVHGPDPWKCI